MMDKTEKILLGIAFVVVTAIVMYTANSSKESLGAEMNILESPAISTAEADSATSSAMVSANVGRQYLQVCNTDAEDAYCAIDETAVVGSGIFLDASGGCYTIDLDNLFIGAFNCIGETASSTLSIIEK